MPKVLHFGAEFKEDALFFFNAEFKVDGESAEGRCACSLVFPATSAPLHKKSKLVRLGFRGVFFFVKRIKNYKLSCLPIGREF